MPGLLVAACLLGAVQASAGPLQPTAPATAPAAGPAAGNRLDGAERAERPDPADLGRGLRYFRAGTLETDLASLAPALASGPLVLDLRAAQGDAVSTARLQELLAQRPPAEAANRPLFVLLSADTPAGIRAAVPAAPAVVTLGCPGPGFEPGLSVSTDPARDRAAVAALAGGRPALDLIVEKLDKPRYDEARLARNHANGHRANDQQESPAKDKPAATSTSAAPAPEAPVQDLVLQRAVFLHRALLALGRLPQKD